MGAIAADTVSAANTSYARSVMEWDYDDVELQDDTREILENAPAEETK